MKYLYTIGILLLYSVINAQENLVPDPSFEENTDCPFSSAQLYMIPEWDRVGGGGGIDYFHSCGGECCNWYDNRVGGQAPRTGEAYVNIGLVHNNHTFPGIIEGNFMGTNLTGSLGAGHRYEVEFYLSLCDSVRFACRNIGVHFSVGQPDEDIDSLLSLEPQIHYDGGFLSDKLGWMKIEGSFIANGGESYLTIGNFDGYENSDTLNLHEGGIVDGSGIYNIGYWEDAYYFLDDVSVVEDTSYHVGIAEIDQSDVEVQVYPNPTKKLLNVSVLLEEEQTAVFVLHNYLGEQMISEVLINGRTEVDVSSLPSGFYHYSVIIDDKIVETGKQVIIK